MKKKQKVQQYKEQMETDCISLTNEIAKLNHQYERIEDKKSRLKNEEEETNSKQLAKVSELSRIFMATENLLRVCRDRKETMMKYDPS